MFYSSETSYTANKFAIELGKCTVNHITISTTIDNDFYVSDLPCYFFMHTMLGIEYKIHG